VQRNRLTQLALVRGEAVGHHRSLVVAVVNRRSFSTDLTIEAIILPGTHAHADYAVWIQALSRDMGSDGTPELVVAVASSSDQIQ